MTASWILGRFLAGAPSAAAAARTLSSCIELAASSRTSDTRPSDRFSPFSISFNCRIFAGNTSITTLWASIRTDTVGRLIVNSKQWWRKAMAKGACAPGGIFQGGGISRKIKKSACVWSFKCFTALNICLPEVFCDCDVYEMHQILLRWPGLRPIRRFGSFRTLSSRLGPWSGRGGRTNVCNRPSLRHW